MKTLIKSTIVAMSLALGAVACAKEEPKKAPEVTKPATKAPDAKSAEPAKPEVKLVCIDRVTNDGKPVIDPKTGKQAQDCKKMRVHKKLEGTQVPQPQKK
jgi:hypothetical protein